MGIAAPIFIERFPAKVQQEKAAKLLARAAFDYYASEIDADDLSLLRSLLERVETGDFSAATQAAELSCLRKQLNLRKAGNILNASSASAFTLCADAINNAKCLSFWDPVHTTFLLPRGVVEKALLEV